MLLLFSAWTQAKPIPLAHSIHLCTEDEDSYPWLLKDKPGLSVQMLHQVEPLAGVQFTITALPWVRCMSEVRTGKMDGLFKISYSPARMAIGVFPMKQGEPDPDFRMLTDSYSLYRIKGSPLNWDGKHLSSRFGIIAIQRGFSIASQLQDAGISIDQETRSAAAIFRKLLAGRVSGAALHSFEGDATLAGNPEWRRRIEKVPTPLVTKNYYLIFSHRFAAQAPKQMQQIWRAIAQVRESSTYLRQQERARHSLRPGP